MAHRRAGKTVAAVNELIKGAITCIKPRPKFNYVAPFLRQAKSVAWEYLKYYAAPVMVDSNESELWVELLNGGRVRLHGADNADAMRGDYSDGDFYDEYGDFKPSVYGNVLRPRLSDRQGWAVFGGTPKGKNQFWDVRETARLDPDEWFLLTLPASTSGLLPQSELDAAAKQLTPDQYDQEYECSFEAAILGSFYGKEMRAADLEGRITAVPHDPAAPVFTAWDLGFSDDTSIWWYQVIGGEIHVIDFYSNSGMNIEHYADQIKARPFKYAVHSLPHDARAKTLASGGKSIIEQLSSHVGLGSLAIVPDIGVTDGIQAVRLMLPRVWFDLDNCGEGLEALRQYQREYDEDKKAFRDKPRHDWTSHPADAFRMLAVAWKEQAKPEPQPQVPRRIANLSANELTLDEAWAATPKKSARI